MKIVLKNKIENSWIFYALIALSCVNFLGRGSLFYFVFALFALIKIRPTAKVDSNSFFALLLTISILFASIYFYDINDVIKAFNYFLLYLIGYSGFLSAEDKMKFAKRTIFSIFIGLAIYVMLTYIYNLGFTFDYQRTLYNIWTGNLIAVTLIGLLSSVIIGYSFYAIVIHKSFVMKAIGIVSVVFVFLINIQTATRTPMIMFVFLYALMILIYFFSTDWRKKIKWLIFGVLLVMIAIVAYRNNVFGIKSYVLSTPIVQRFTEEGLETSRVEIFRYYLEHMFDNIWGGRKISQIYGVLPHNFIQEAHDQYGILATIALLGITVGILVNIIRLIFLKNKEPIDFLFISMYVAIIIQICLEPAFDGYPVVIMSLMLMHGIVVAYLSERSELIRSDVS